MRRAVILISAALAGLCMASCTPSGNSLGKQYYYWDQEAEGYYILNLEQGQLVNLAIMKKDHIKEKSLPYFYKESDASLTEIGEGKWRLNLWGEWIISDITSKGAKMHPENDDSFVYDLIPIKHPVKLVYHEVPKSTHDLGLSVYWAEFNMLLSLPTEEIQNGFDGRKWNSSIYDDYNYLYGDYYKWPGAAPTEDPVRKALGGKWRMPTSAEMRELLDLCEWEWYEYPFQKGQKKQEGFLIWRNKPGYEYQAIFLPAAGGVINNNTTGYNTNGYYWTTTVGTSESVSCGMEFDKTARQISIYDVTNRYTIRPVWDPSL